MSLYGTSRQLAYRKQTTPIEQLQGITEGVRGGIPSIEEAPVFELQQILRPSTYARVPEVLLSRLEERLYFVSDQAGPEKLEHIAAGGRVSAGDGGDPGLPCARTRDARTQGGSAAEGVLGATADRHAPWTVPKAEAPPHRRRENRSIPCSPCRDRDVPC